MRRSSAQEQRGNAPRELWDLKWVREPQQDRSAQTRGKLMDAAESLLAEEGMSAVTIARVTRRAQSSNGSFYHYFQDKKALLYAVVERRAIEVADTVARGLEPAQWESVPVIDILEGYVRFSLKSGKRNIGVLEAQRVLAMEDAHIAARWARTNQETRASLMRILRPKFAEIGHREPRVAVELLLESLRAMINMRLRGYLPGAKSGLPRMSEEAFVKELRLMASRYLSISE